jgi:dynein heavy chain
MEHDSRKSKLARLSGREGEMASTAMLSLGSSGLNSRGYYKQLYKFDVKKELEEWDLPFAQTRTKPSGAILSNTRLPPLENQSEEDQAEEVIYDSYEEELNLNMLQKMLSSSKQAKGALISGAQETLFVDRESYIFKELKKIRTGEDAISFFAKNGNTTPVKFLHCNMAPHSKQQFRPYDLIVVPEKEIGNEYYTVSAQGVVYVCPRDSEGGSTTTFYSLSDWMHQSKMFNLLTSMNFFKHYLIGKVFQSWRGNVRYKRYCATRRKLANKLFHAKPVFLDSFPKVNEHLYSMGSAKLLELKESRMLDIAAYSDEQRESLNEAKKDFEGMIERLINEVESVCQSVKDSTLQPELEELEQAKITQKNKKKSIVQQKMEEKERKRKQRMAEEHKNMLGYYIRLVDYMTIETLVGLIQQCLKKFYDEMMERKTKLFNTFVKYGKDCMLFNPDEDEFHETLDGIIDRMTSEISGCTRLLYHFDELVAAEHLSHFPQVDEILKSSKSFKRKRSSIHDKIHIDFEEARVYVDHNFEKARPVNDYVETWNFELFKTEVTTVQSIKDELSKIKEWLNKDVPQYVPSHPNASVKGILNIEGKTIRGQLFAALNNAQTDIKNHLNFLAKSKADAANDELIELNRRLSSQPSALSDFVTFVEDVKTAEIKIKNLEAAKLEVDEIAITLRREKFTQDMASTTMKIDEFTRNCEECKKNIEAANKYIEEIKPDMEKKLSHSVEKMKAILVNEVLKKLDEPPFTEVDAQVDECLAELRKIENKLKKCQENGEKYKHYQEIFEMTQVRVKELEDANAKFNQKNLLWSNRKQWSELSEEWFHEDFLGLNSSEIEKRVNKFNQDALRLRQELGRWSKDGKDPVVEILYSKIQEVKQVLPVITDLGNPALRTRHWVKIFGLLESDVEYVEGRPFCLQELIDWGVLSVKDKVEEISASASGEYGIESSLEDIRKTWSSTYFVLNNYREQRDRFYITGIEDVLTQLEDHQVSIQTMLGNRHVTEIRGSIEEWDRKLKVVQDVIDEWLSCQKQWQYLENIFSAPDIQKQLPRENTKFQGVDKFWRDVMIRTNKNPLVLEACTQDGLYDRFVKNNAVLEDIKKCLDEYLESKRMTFPRFYFLADEELLEILSQTRNPHTVQNHLRKCFDNMDKIIFTDVPESTEIIGMISGEKEVVSFSKSVLAQGNVEHWLARIEEGMKQSLYDLTKKSYQVYPTNGLKRRHWCFEESLPAQCLLIVDQIMWTFNSTEAIQKLENGTDPKALHKFQDYCKHQINDMVEIVRGDLNYLQRNLIGALIVLDVHGRDVIASLNEKNVRSVHDFEWAKQLKYYWEKDVDNCIVRQTNAKFGYGYEYLGNTPRLVITPLTDKCYMTLTGALHLYYGGAPAGPAGTGKTETTKDLGKALAVLCVVFNCSDGLDVNIMARFFSGLAQAGAWSCFDEFNRIDIEVLSVIAEQILTIQQSIRGGLEEFEFFGRLLRLDRRFGVFITMNPSYAGRTELPDNLKALFRPVAMMIPDYAMIAEIVLFSEGFTNARDLARKMVQLYKLASEQLSKQDHYDFGMRAVKSVLVMAGQLRRRDPDLDEDVVLIRAMRDSNVPKFLEQDLPLFRGIIKDLFPTVTVPYIDYGDLERAIRNQLHSKNYRDPDNYILKVIQLLETMLVRHGNMVVGAAGSGKTNIYKTLAEALTQLYEEGSKDPAHQKIFYYPLNPKAITMGQLYGQTTLTGDFSDGIVPILVRAAKADDTPAKKWIVFDGPVDAKWIESMNTVLDDNKMLCLFSGERIKLPDTITMLFEVQDLAQASPATVSRCGMVYLDPVHLGWVPVLETWAIKYKEQMPKYADLVVNSVKDMLAKLLPFVRNECKEEIGSVNVNLVTSCLNLLTALLKEEKIAKKRPDDAEKLIYLYIIFCITWSVGANLSDSSRPSFDKKFRFEMESIYREFPIDSTVYDYCIDDDMVEFVPWETRVTSFNYSSRIPYFNILVPTVDTVRYKFLLDTLLRKGSHVIFMGQTGVGKSVIVKDYLMDGSNESFLNCNVNFSAQTSTLNLYDVLEDKLTQRKKNLLGPPIGKKMIIFVDDVNMPALDEYGSQAPVELLRQVIEKGYYDLKKFFFKNVVDTLFVSCCAPPGGGRNPVTPRFFRHFNMIWQPQLSQKSMETIFSSILRGFLDEHPEENLSDFADPIVKSSVEVYLKICNDLLPTPSKSHYTFNLRDLSKVVQGILQISYENLKESTTLILLWLHESCRVFRDRLIDDKDNEWFNTQLQSKMKEHLDMTIPKESWVDVIFGHFASHSRDYVKIDYNDALFAKLGMALERYNAENSNQMNLIFFKDAINHLSRISRIIRQPRGNALLVGVGGSGRQSLARLAINMADYKIFSIEITRIYGVVQFHEDLKNLLRMAGANNEPVVFLFSDTQIVKESFLEDINNILNTGEVPNLFEVSELEEIVGLVRPLAKEAGKIDTRDVVLAYFTQLVRENLHIVLAFSPVGEQFRVRCRQFPSIINCCTIDWYKPWPEDALSSVAQRFFQENASLGVGELKEPLSKICVEIHTSVTKKGEAFYQELRRRNYTTPTSYLELIRLYLDMLKEQQSILPQKINRYKIGLKRLKETNEMVNQLQKELVELQPILVQSRIDNEKLMVELQIKQADAKVTEESCSKDEAECAITMKEVSSIKDECQSELDEALPALMAATRALDSLEKKDIVEMKSYVKPPEPVEKVMSAVCIMFNKKQTWDDGKKLLNDMDFLKNCQNYPKDDISNATLRKLQTFINDPEFNRGAVFKVSPAAASLCEWIVALDKYSKVARNVEPKRLRLKEAEDALRKAQDQLFIKQSALKAVQDQVADLEATFQASVRKGEELKIRSEVTEARLSRAEKLVSGLSSESQRWLERAKQLEGDLKNLVGNILIAAGYIAYLGPFTLSYRENLLEGWMRFTQMQRIPVDSSFSLEGILADPVQVREWTLAGLPADQLSKDNGIIVTRGRRWPLIIDPQGQANHWIKNMDRETIKTIKLTEPSYLKTLENGIRFGNPILLENVEEHLDPSIDPVLQKQIYKKGGQMFLRLGDQDVPYSQDFRFYITSKLANPHYLPEICIKVTIINFTVTPEGLEDQLLVDVVRVERPDLEELKNKLIIQISSDKDMLQELEEKILKLISEASVNILDDEVLIETLAASKKTSEVIHDRMQEAEKTAEQIDHARNQYREVAKRGSILYFVIASLGMIDPMYQYSLEFFSKLYNMRLNKSQKSPELQRRLNILVEDITKSFYTNICRGLFEKDKLLYSFLNAVKIGLSSGRLSSAEWAYYLKGIEASEGEEFDKNGLHIKAPQWKAISGLEDVTPNFIGIRKSFEKYPFEWKAIMQSDEPHIAKLPEPYHEILTGFQRLLLLSILKEEKMMSAIKQYVAYDLGQEFIESPPFDLKGAFEDSNCTTPIIFVLSPGADPISDLIKLAKDIDMYDRMKTLSLGQGQGKRAEKMIEQGRMNGGWVCLQNCHLAKSWMEDLERIQEQQVESDTHPEFRLWLTSLPSKFFPVPVLQSGIKLTNEPPKGLRANLGRTFQDINQDNYAGCSKSYEYKKLLFSLAFFHAVILERRKFGAIGWNIPYEWMTSDFVTCQAQLFMYLNEQPEVPYTSLKVIVAEINYGGRVTDDKDVRLITALLEKYFTPEVMSTEYSFSQTDTYKPPISETVDQVRGYIRALPLDDDPDVFGLHSNSNITFNQKTVRDFRETLTLLHPKSGGSALGKSPDQIASEIAMDIESRLPAMMNPEREQHPDTFSKDEEGAINSLGVFVGQEISRFNKLLSVMKRTLVELQKAIRGDVVMSFDLEKMYNSFLNSKVPGNWSSVSYPSLKPLGSWVRDMIKRVEFMHNWLTHGPRPTYWLSAFFFPQGFMTSALQVYSRKTRIPIDTLKFRADVINKNSDQITQAPEVGVNIHGLFMQGAKWDWKKSIIDESDPGVLFIEMPAIWLEPVNTLSPSKGLVYPTPLYKTSTRAGELSTTGHSTNFVLFLELPTVMEPKHWIRRGVALLSQLDD